MKYKLIEGQPGLSIIETILTNRGIPLEEVEHYLNTTDDDILNPELLNNMREGAMMLTHHISEGHKILVRQDPDCDGYTAAAIIINYLYCLFPDFVKNNISYIIPNGKEHSIQINRIPDDVKLVIAPDAGSSDVEQIAELHNRGIDVLCLDHHLQDEAPAFGCIINNQLSENYPNKTLSGAGVTYKFCQYLDLLAETNHADKFLDLAAVGIVGDVMDLRNFETRRIVNKGLMMENIRNSFLEAIIERQRFPLTRAGAFYEKSISAEGIAWFIVPLINGMVRSGTQEEKTLLFEAMLDFKGNELIESKKRGANGRLDKRVEEAARVCINVKKRQDKSKNESAEYIEDKIKQENLLDNKIIILKLKSGQIDRNISGLIANKIMSQYGKPTLVLFEKTNDDGKDVWAGSVRAPQGCGIDNFKTFMNETNLCESNGGHEASFGTEILATKIDEFTNYTNHALKDFDFTPDYKVDFIYQSKDLAPEDVLTIAEYKPWWGHGVEEPYVAIENIKINKHNIDLLSKDKNPTLKIVLPQGISLIKFKSGQEEYDSLYSELGSVIINAVGRCQRNEWNGVVTPQLIIEDFSIVDRTDYDF